MPIDRDRTIGLNLLMNEPPSAPASAGSVVNLGRPTPQPPHTAMSNPPGTGRGSARAGAQASGQRERRLTRWEFRAGEIFRTCGKCAGVLLA